MGSNRDLIKTMRLTTLSEKKSVAAHRNSDHIRDTRRRLLARIELDLNEAEPANDMSGGTNGKNSDSGHRGPGQLLRKGRQSNPSPSRQHPPSPLHSHRGQRHQDRPRYQYAHKIVWPIRLPAIKEEDE
jgi:hypothetical protein